MKEWKSCRYSFLQDQFRRNHTDCSTGTCYKYTIKTFKPAGEDGVVLLTNRELTGEWTYIGL